MSTSRYWSCIPRWRPAPRASSLASAAGSERKTTGSYYTPDSLVQCLLETALDPVLDDACGRPDPEAALLALSVCDPACGSGHFLIAAARRIARRLAQVRTGDPEPDPEALRHALRDVIGQCLYGVDLNPMAVELCKVSLWLEALEPGRPLSYLDHQIQCGNSLLGTTPGLLANGLPDAAFEPIEGDDKQIASALKKRNRAERQEDAQQQTMFGAFVRDAGGEYGTLASQAASLRALADDDIAALRRKEQAFTALARSETYRQGRLLADAWCAAFVWPKQKGAPDAPTAEVLRRLGEGAEQVPAATRAEIARLAGSYRFFHWHLAFPELFGTGAGGAGEGGFDVVLSNPPWERIKLQEKEFFATRHPGVASAPNAAARRREIDRLREEDPALHAEFLAARRAAEGESHFVRRSGRYPLCGRGDVNTYAVFAESMRDLVAPTGRVGAIVPSGIATDDTTKFFFQDLSERGSLASLYDFENARPIFPGVHRSYKFSLVTLSGSGRPVREGAELAFFLHDPTELADDERRFRLSAADLALLNPNTRTCPIFRSRRDAELTKWIYRRVPVLVREGPPEENPWGASFTRLFDMSNDSGLFRTREQLEQDGWTLEGNIFEKDGERMLPLYEGRLGHQFNHRFAQQPDGQLVEVGRKELSDPNFLVETHYWVNEGATLERLDRRDLGCRSALLGFRRVARDTDERTCIATLFGFGAASYGWILSLGPDASALTSLLATYNSFSFDYLLRSSLSQPSIPQGVFEQVACPRPDVYRRTSSWSGPENVEDWLRPRVLELTYTAWDLAPFAQDLGYDGPPFRWDEARRFQLRCELDAAFLHLYLGPPEDWQTNAPPEPPRRLPHPRAAAAHILDSFPIVQRKDEATHGEYRTKRVILEIYDALQKAIDTGVPYPSRLDPPPPTHVPPIPMSVEFPTHDSAITARDGELRLQVRIRSQSRRAARQST
ncbi:MAG: SAM-dependent methyltransferase [Myxococcota bacterium]|nr:SAM-dependent methyltransferase [Myxococcota bacterium]